MRTLKKIIEDSKIYIDSKPGYKVIDTRSLEILDRSICTLKHNEKYLVYVENENVDNFIEILKAEREAKLERYKLMKENNV